MAPTSTAIFGAYNVESYVGQAVSSIATQVDEVVVVDDASSDKTLEVLRYIALKHKNVRILSNEMNLGISYSYNLAAEHASGEILFVCGSDDVSLPHRVPMQLASLTAREEIGATFSKPALIRSDGLSLNSYAASEFIPNPIRGDVFGHLVFLGNFLLAPSAALHRDLFLKLGGFTRNLDLLQDYELWLKIAQISDIAINPSPVVEYRKRIGSSSGLSFSRESRLAREMAERSFILSNLLSTSSEKTIRRLLDFAKVRGHIQAGVAIKDLKTALEKVLKLDAGRNSQFEFAMKKSETMRDIKSHVFYRQAIKELFAFE